MHAGQVHARLAWTPLGRHRATLDVDLAIEPGERVLVVGRSGSGKSTLLHALTGALGETIAGEISGSVSLGGVLGLVPQSPADGIVAATVERDVAFGPENLGLSRAEIRARVSDSLAAVGLSVTADHATSALSGGEAHRLVLAGVLAMRPDIMALDEPTSMLDPVTAASVRRAVMDVVGDRTLVVVEHRFADWLVHMDRVIVLDAGRVVFDGSVTEFLAAQAASWAEGLWFPGTIPAAPHPGGHTTGEVRGAPVIFDAVAVDLVTRSLTGKHRVRALDDFSASFAPGEVTAVVGPSGAGKSTALLAAAGLVKTVAGTVTPNRARLKPRELAAGLGWVPQNPEHGFVTTRVRDEVTRTAGLVGMEVDADGVLESVGLARFAQTHPYRLSGGEQRRLAMAAALAHRPGLVLLDEPTVGQDPQSWALICGWLSAAAQEGATVAVSTHDTDLPRDATIELAGSQPRRTS